MESFEEKKAVSYKNCIVLLLGNFLEFFEFSLFAVYAPFFSEHFLKKISTSMSLFYTLSIFAAGFLARPIGAIVFGHIGDKFGRKVALMLSVFGMSFATFVIGILPISGHYGLLIPILLLCSRIIQGVSCGGEYNGVTVYLHEMFGKTPALMGAFASVSGMFGALVATIFCFCCLNIVQTHHWLWRLPFLLSIILGFISLYLRSKLEESQEFKKIEEDKRIVHYPLKTAFKKYFSNIFTTFTLGGLNGIQTYSLIVFLNILLQEISSLTKTEISLYNIFNMITYIVACLLTGYCIDKYKISIYKALLVLILLGITFSLPLYFMLFSNEKWTILLASSLLAVIAGSFSGLCNPFICELFPSNLRYTGVSIGYSLGISLLGGTTPVICHMLMRWTVNPLSCAGYLISGAILCLFGILLTRRAPLIFLRSAPRVQNVG